MEQFMYALIYLIYHFTILISFDTYYCIALNLIYYLNYLIPCIRLSCNAHTFKLYLYF